MLEYSKKFNQLVNSHTCGLATIGVLPFSEQSLLDECDIESKIGKLPKVPRNGFMTL